MRLTLRTLLALRNKTLRPQDEAVLKEKVRESSYAQQLLELIGTVVSNARLSALPPTATGPTDDPNVMAEYLDSTLAPEQAAEVDRTCLESPLHLAEAAGSHEVLTLVLGRPADVSPELRERVYALSSYSAETLDAPRVEAAEPVTPVSLDDSGAFQAATRLAPTAASSRAAPYPPGPGQAKPVIAGDRPLNAAEASEIFGDRLHTSRVVPWLVSLALVGILLFVLKQAFDPLLDKPSQVAVQDDETPAIVPGDPDREAGPEALPDSAQRDDTQGDDAQPGPAPPAADPTNDTQAEEPDMEPAPADDPKDLPAVVEVPAKDPVMDAADAGDDAPRVADASIGSTDSANATPDNVTPAAAVAAHNRSSQSLLLGLTSNGEHWRSIEPDAEITDGTTLISPPTYRNRLAVDQQYELTLVGPAMAKLTRQGEQTGIELQSGRMVISSLAEGVRVPLRIDGQSFTVELPAVGAALAVEARPFRAPGTDPTNPENHVLASRATVVVGPVRWQNQEGEAEELNTAQQRRQVGDGTADKVTLEEMPKWIDSDTASSVDKTARETLLSLLPTGQPVALGLREAIHFRRAEVVALAARTLAMLGHFDVYFGAEGVLNMPTQKSYWEDHVATLKSRIDASPEAAKELLADAIAMDEASAKPLFRLLWGYSPEQLQTGSDAFLVETLDSPQTALRVLAIENLRRITGTSLFFKPEEENAARRKADVKKWDAKLRREDIRWQSVPIAGVSEEPLR